MSAIGQDARPSSRIRASMSVFTVHEAAELIGVEFDASGIEAIPGRHRLDEARRKAAPQAGQMVLQSRRRISRRLRRPQRLDGRVGRHHSPSAQHEQREQPSLQAAPRCHVPPDRVPDAQGAEHLDPYPGVRGCHETISPSHAPGLGALV